MFRDMLNFKRINWWTFLGGAGLNLLISLFASFIGAYLAANEATSDFYMRFGPVLMVLAVFLACGLAGFIISKIADDVPLKHAFLSSLGAVIPFFAAAVLSINPMLLMMAGVAVAGNLNGGMLGLPKPRYRSPDRER